MRVAWRASYGQRDGLPRRLGLRGRLRRARIGAGAGMLALAVPLAWPSGAGGQHLDLPSASSVRSGLVRLADWVTDDSTPTPTVPAQQAGTAAGKKHIVPVSVTQGLKHATGHAPGKGAGQLPAWAAHAPSGAPGGTYTSGPAVNGFNPATSTQVAAQTTARSDLYRNADGSYTRKVWQDPVNYQTSSGSWAPIDETLAKGSGSRWQEAANSVPASFAPAGSDQALGTLASPDGSETVSFSLAGAAAVTGVASGSSVTYPGILPGTDVTETATATGISESLTLDSASVATSWVFPLKLTGLTATLDDDSVDLSDSAGNVVWVIPPATARSGPVNLGEADSQASSQLSYQLVTYNGGPALQMSLDSSWLSAPGRVFPVTVDPTFSPNPVGSTYVESKNGTAETANNGGSEFLPSGTVTTSNGTFDDIDFLDFSGQVGDQIPNQHVTAASLYLFDVWAYQCTYSEDVYAYQVTSSWSPSSSLTYPGPSYGTKDAQWTGTASSRACSNTSGLPGQGAWISLGFNSSGLTLLNDWTLGQPVPNDGFAVAPSLTDEQMWKQFDSANDGNILSSQGGNCTGNCEPYLQLTYSADTPPQIDSQYPPDNYNSPTLTPELMATGHDTDSWPNSSVQYTFTVYNSAGTVVASANKISAGDWTVPAGALSWGQTYYWTVQDYDGLDYSPAATVSYFSTPVPQPLITSQLSQNSTAPGFNSQTGDWTTSATDASVATAGPALEITRDYNSEDPRLSGAFGGGWSSVLDMKASPGQGNSSGASTEVVTYPDGEDIAFGVISGSPVKYAAPPGRYATLATVSAGGFTLTDKNDTIYTFTQSLGSGVYGITSIADALGRTETFGYNSSSQITTITSASGRTLTVTWASPSGAAYQHVASVVTDDATAGNASTAQDWTYTYSGDELATACPPSSVTACTSYSYTNGTDYPQSVLDSGPQSYWRLDETSGSTAASSVLLNEHTDDATYSNVSLASAGGGLAGSSARVVNFNGTSSDIQIPNSLADHGAYMSVSLWFWTTTANTVLFSYQPNPLTTSTTSGGYLPAIYIGSDGKLNAQFYTGTFTPMTSPSAVDDGKWHMVTLTTAGNTQALYLDGQQIRTMSGTVSTNTWSWIYLGGGFTGGKWPDESHYSTSSNTGYASYYRGYMSDAATWSRPLTTTEVAAMYAAGTHRAALVTKVTRPTGSVDAQVSYDPLTGWVTQLTDDKGGTWQLQPQQPQGSSQVWVASVLGAHPKDYWRLNDTGVAEAQNLMNCSCDSAAYYYNVTEGVTGGPFADSPVASFNGTSSYLSMPSADENTTGPGSVGVWFKTTGSSEVLYSEQSAAVSSGATSPSFAPVLYVGADGKLNGEFWMGAASRAISSQNAVNDGKWHYAVLAAGTSSQSLYVDGALQATLAGTLDGAAQPYVAVGAGYLGGAWPDTSSSTVQVRWFTGDIAEVAWYPAQLTAAQVTGQWDTSKYASGLTPVQTTNVTDPGSNTLSWTYDLLNGGRVLSHKDANGYVTTYGYDTGGFQDETTEDALFVTETGYDVRGNMVSRTTCQDQAANQCSTSYWTYYPDDTSTSLNPDARNDVVLTYADGRSASATDTTYQTKYAYNSNGELTGETTPPVTGFPSGRTTTYAYTDGSTTAGGYNGAVPPKGLPYQVTTPGAAVTTTLYYADGDAAQVTTPDGQRTVYTYDGLGRKASQTVYSDSYPAGLATTYSYNADGQLQTQTGPAVTNRVTGAVHTAQTTTGYDADGNVTSQEVADRTGGDSSRTVTKIYNAYDELASQTDAANATTSYTYDGYGNVASKTDPDGNVTGYTYDGDGNLLTTTLENYTGSPPGSQPAAPLVEESRSYDGADRLAYVTDAMGNQTGYTYYDNGLVATVGYGDPSGDNWHGSHWYAYDGAGNVTEDLTNNDTTDTTYTVDAADRVTQQVTDPAGLDRATTVSYTPDDRQASVIQSGPDGTSQQTSYTYDPAGNTLSQTVTDPGAGGPAAWFPLTQASGTAVADSAAGGQPATASGVTWTGSAAQFTGTSGQQVATAGPVIDTTGTFTVAAWVNLAGNTSSDQAVVAQAAGTASGFSLKYSASSGGWQFTRPLSDTASPSVVTAASGSAAATGTWTFLTGTFDGNTGTVTLYVNGAKSGSTATDTSPISAHGPLLVGADQAAGAAADFLDGQVADVQVYLRALSAAEVSSLYGLGQGGGDVTTGKLVTTWTRDQRGLPTSMTDPDGAITGYSYDEAGRLAVTTDPMVTTETYGLTPVTARPVTTTGYDTFGDTTETEDADGNVTTYGYDADSRQVSTALPPYTPPGGSPVTAIETTGYDGDGNVTSASDGIGNTTAFGYDQLGDQVTVTAPDSSVTTTAYDADRQPLSVTGPTGAQTQATWTYLGQKATSTQIERDTDSGTAAYTTTYSYGTNGRLSQQTSPDGVSTQYAYDPAGAVTSVTDGAGNVTGYTYDGLGRPTTITYPDSTSQVTGYDAVGDATSVKQMDASGHTLTTTSATFDGEGDQLSSTDPRGDATTFTYDPTGLVSQEVQPVSASSGITTSFGYDAAGNQTRYTDGNGNSWWDTYNSWGLQESRIAPPTAQYSSAADSTVTTAYDADGRPATVTEPGGVTVADSYNNVGELTGQSGAGADAATPTRSFGYDTAGDLTSASTTNTASSGSNATSETFTYNDRGLVLTASGSAGSTSYGYNGDGQATAVADAAGTTSYTYDDADRLATLSDPATGTMATYGYNSDSQVTGISYGPGGDAQTFGYDSLHQLTSGTLKTASGTTVASVSYGYNPDGQVTSQTTTGLAGPSSSMYTYDEAGRLASWNNGTTTAQYGYDGDGNLTSNGSKTYTYDARDELTGDGSNTYSYTARGTPASESTPAGSAAVAFDAYGDQATAGSMSYGYDALGRLVSDVPAAGGSEYTFSYAGTTGAIASDGGSTYTWDPSGTMLTGIGAAGGGSSGALAFTDPHGDVLGQFTATGTAMAGSQAFDPWGTVTVATGTLLGGLGFQSAWNDPGTGKNLMGARWYSTASGSFTSADTVQVPPVPNPAAGNPFAYAGDDPLDATDPTGHCLLLNTGFGTVCAGGTPVSVGVATKQPTINPRTKSTPDPDPGVGLKPGTFAGSQPTIKNQTGGGIVDALSQLMYQEWQQQIYQQQQAGRGQPKNVSDGSGSGGNASDGPIKTVSSGGSSSSAPAVVIPPWHPYHAPGPAKPVLTPGPNESAILASVAATIAALSASALDSTGGLGSQLLQQASGEVAGWIQDYGPQILGALAGLGVLAACEGLTAGAATPVCSALGGATSGGVSYLLGASQSGTVTGGGFLGAALKGGAQWAAGGVLGDIVGSVADTAGTTAEEGGANDAAATVACGGMSFTAGTKVLLANGKTKAISHLHKGEEVLATDTRTGKTSLETITAVEVNHDTDLYDLRVKTSHGTETIHSTTNHLFWDPYPHYGWIPAKHLKPGMHLKTPDGQSAVVVGGSVPAVHDGWMWDLTVPGNDDHDFYVTAGATAVLVHNIDEQCTLFDDGPYRAPVRATLKIGDDSFSGTSLARGNPPIKGTFSFFVEHAEGDAFSQAVNSGADYSGASGTLSVTQEPCGFCVSSISAVARSMGLSYLRIETPEGLFGEYTPETGLTRTP